MGASLSWLSSLFFDKKPCKLILIGLDNAGKTTALYRLNLGQTVTTTPTIGSNVETVQHDHITFEIWDLGGQSSLRASWSLYYESADAVIMVVDSTDRARMSIVKQELQNMPNDRHLRGVPLLVLANKQDLADAMGVMELTETLELQKITTHDWHIQPCCAKTGSGLIEGLGWISQRINNHLRSTK